MTPVNHPMPKLGDPMHGFPLSSWSPKQGSEMNINGKVFIVTGGASGLGEGTARMLAANGGKVVIADMQADKGEAVAKDIGGVFVKCDVSQEADGQAVVAAALKLGKLVAWSTAPALPRPRRPWVRTGRTRWPCSARPSRST